MKQTLRSYGKKYLLLYALSAVGFVFLAFDVFGPEKAQRSTKVAFLMLGAGLLAAGVRLCYEYFYHKGGPTEESEEQ